MKKLTTILTALALFLTTTAFTANANIVNSTVEYAFSQKFSKAENVTWKKIGALNFAYFQIENRLLIAAYSNDAELVSLSRTIEFNQIPLSLALSLDENFGTYVLSSKVTEIAMDGGTSYFLTAENNEKVLTLKCNADGEIEVIGKVKNKYYQC